MLKQYFTVRLLLICVATGLSSPVAFSQKKGKEKEDEKKYREDPYTENVEEVWRAAGYEKMGDFAWADGHGTVNIEDAIGEEEMIFIETKNFKIGCCLPEYTISRDDKVEKAKINDELDELREIIPNIPKRVKKLDKWLRLHLFAMRAEKLYAEIEKTLQVSSESFPTGPGQLKDGKYMGEGPYLGMKSKFTLLLFDKESSIGRYRTAFMNQSGIIPIRHMFPADGTLLYACASQNEGLFSDTTMHCAMVYAVTQNLLNGYRYYSHALPTWLPVGLSHYFARKIDPKRNYFTDKRLYGSDDKNIWKWDVKARKRVDHEIAVPYAKMVPWGQPTSLSYNDHVMAWSRVDYLMSEHPDWLAQWLYRVQDSYPVLVPTAEQIGARDSEIVSEVFIYDEGDFDSNWGKWVLKNYSKK
ncbi:MAG: helix-loop-helix domain-containing protein [Planctomycetota bacterium]|jgi:hypothetical protein|nr:helix-loop-helix domain-containing protein [Planctomycetota bacterium]